MRVCVRGLEAPMRRVEGIAIAIMLSICVASCGEGPKGEPGPAGPPGAKGEPGPADLLVHQGRPALEASKALPDRQALPLLAAKMRYGLCAPIARLQHAGGSAMRTTSL
jgi:hypothetical protein